MWNRRKKFDIINFRKDVTRDMRMRRAIFCFIIGIVHTLIITEYFARKNVPNSLENGKEFSS